jgi:hypothetical protein
MVPSPAESIMMHSFSHVRGTPGARSRRRRSPTGLAALLALGLLAVPRGAAAQNPVAGETDSAHDESARAIGVSLDPSSPQASALPGGMTPAFGQKSQSSQDWRFDFHGYLTAPLNAGFNKRTSPPAGPGQSTTVLHAPPVVPDDLETFSHTGVVPTTYAQLNLSDGNNVVSANVSILARQTNVSESFLEPSSQLGISDAFLAYLPRLGERVRLRVLVGAFTSRYGSSGEYDEGRYGTPLIARINGAGELVSAKLALAPQYTLVLEQGLQGQTNTAGAGVTADVWNNFANPEEGTTFVNHFHAALGYRSLATVGVHFINAQSHDEKATGTLQPDGALTILAADARFTMHRFGHLYLAVASAKATHALTVSRIISVLNTPGGAGLANDYLGPGGDATGTVTTVGGQYDLSVGRLVNYPTSFQGDGPDVFVSLFGMAAVVSSALTREQIATVSPFDHSVYGDGVTKLKLGVEATYSVLPWLAFSGRFDRVEPDISDTRSAFSIISPRVILRTGWWATDQVVLQYSHWFNGSFVTVRTGEPPKDDLMTVPDADVLSLSASMWW